MMSLLLTEPKTVDLADCDILPLHYSTTKCTYPELAITVIDTQFSGFGTCNFSLKTDFPS